MYCDNKLPKQQVFFICCFGMLVSIMAISCTSLGLQNSPKATQTSIVPKEPNIIEPTEAAQLSRTPIVIDTPVISPTSEPLLPTATNTLLPTLTFDEKDMIMDREVLLQELMSTNGGCQLPCWWGVEIGDNLENAGQKFKSLGMPGWNVGTSVLGDGGLMGSIITGYYDTIERLFDLRVSATFHANLDNNIQYIRISVLRPSASRGEAVFIDDWQQYSLNSMLQNYGRPSQVYLRIRSVADVTPTPIYSLSLYYPDKGISVTYNFEGVWLDDSQLDAEICLDMENVNPLEMSLFVPNDFDEWPEYFPPFNDDLYEISTWEAQTGMNLDTFYQTYQDPNNLECVQIIN